eukprot:TRINITY_DN1913_c0_g2_i1.p1 TRINITY_DN1913_c0_g2~~TRINITY_DN1913_c0_g2_i1.p1  ORF type:complete len:804 (+),score=249.82 TRINITY_DN1913_c0_g2_i1:146-2557(+)
MPAKKKAPKGPKKEQVKEGLLLEEREAGGAMELLFHNTSRDKQFKVKVSAVKGEVKAVGQTQADGDTYVLSIHPGEVLTMLQGKWDSYKKSIGSGPPEKEWLKAQHAEAAGLVEKDIAAVKAVLKAKGVQRVTAEATAQACADSGIKFLDVTFPPRDSSLKPDWLKRDMKTYPWKRPDSFLEGTGLQPALFVGEIEPNDIDQGALADCYLMGALSAVAEFERLVRSIFESGQDPDLGLYRVSICKNGWWQTVIVDDFLPCSGPKPAYARNREEPNELWVSLVEKAYAKIHGSFGAIMSGGSAPALGDLTGCPYKTMEFKGEGATSFDELLSNDEHEFLQVLGTPGRNIMYLPEASVKPDEKALWDKYQAVGLVCEHSYSLISVKKTKKGDQLCFIRNPWGNEEEWKGKWNDNDTENWTDEVKAEVGFQALDDGSFWMAYEDVVQWFNTISVCYCHGTWDQVRCAGNFESGCSDLVLQVECKAPCRVWWGLHQKDIRGCKPGTPDAAYTGMNLFVVTPGKEGKMKALVNTGTQKRDVYQEAALKAGQTAFMIGQPKDAAVTKSFVYSLLIEEKDNVVVTFRTASKKRYEKAQEFDAGDWKPTEAVYQIKGQFSTNGTVTQRQGKAVSFAGAAEEALLKERAQFEQSVDADRKKGKLAKEATTKLEIEVGVLKGRKLAAKDDTGKSDPYCEVKLRAFEGGKVLGSHRSPQKQVTSVKQQTLEPEWNEKVKFLSTAGDAVRVQCFDKDEVGKEALGYVDLVLPELIKKGLKAGGPEVTDWYPVVGEACDGEVSGDLQVSVKILKEF